MQLDRWEGRVGRWVEGVDICVEGLAFGAERAGGIWGNKGEVWDVVDGD